MLEKDYGFNAETTALYMEGLSKVSERIEQKLQAMPIKAGLVLDMEGVLVFDSDEPLPDEEEIHDLLYKGSPSPEGLARRKEILGIYDFIDTPYICVMPTSREIGKKLELLEQQGVLPLMVLSAASYERVFAILSVSEVFNIPQLPFIAHPRGSYSKLGGAFKTDVLEMTFDYVLAQHGIELPLIMLDDRESFLQPIRLREHQYLRPLFLRNGRTKKHPLPTGIMTTSWSTIEQDILQLI